MSSNSSNYDVIIIGAGPSGIFCAYELIQQKPDLKILMVEKGRRIENSQIFMKDTRKGCLDISKAGELGIVEAYEVLKRYAPLEK